MLKQSFKQQLVEHRQKQQLTQEQLGCLIGVEKQCIGNYEQGTRLPDLAMLTQLGEALNVDIFTRDGEFFFVEAGKIAPLFDKVDNQLAFIQEIHEIQQEDTSLNMGELLQRFYQKDWLTDEDDRQHTFTFPTEYLTFIQHHSTDFLSLDLCFEIKDLLKSEELFDLIIIDGRKRRQTYVHRVHLMFEKAEQVREIQQRVIDAQIDVWLYYWGERRLTVKGFHEQLCKMLTLALSGFTVITIQTDSLQPENMASFKHQLTRKRLEKGLTQEELAQLLKKHPLTLQTISHYENGDREPNLEKIVELGEVLQCDMVIRKGGSFCFYDQATRPLFFSSKDHVETIKQLLEQSIIPNPNQLWITLDENNLISQGYVRDYSNYLRPQSYRQFYRNYAGQPWTPELKQALIESFKGEVMDELWVTDCASANEVFSIGFRFIYKQPDEAYKLQQEGVLELIEWAERVEEKDEFVLYTFNDSFYDVFGGIIGDQELERVEVIA